MKLFRKLFQKDYNPLLYTDINYAVFFTKESYRNIPLKTLSLGDLYLPTGEIVGCDPLVCLSDWKPFTRRVNPGKYPVAICIADTGEFGQRYAVVEVRFSEEEPIKWEMALTEGQNQDELQSEGEYFGYPVDAGLGCFCDCQSQKFYKEFVSDFCRENPDGNIYVDYFASRFKMNADPNDPNDIGDWINFEIPDSEGHNVIMFHSGYGDGYYPCYWGLDRQNRITRLIVDFMVLDESE